MITGVGYTQDSAFRADIFQPGGQPVKAAENRDTPQVGDRIEISEEGKARLDASTEKAAGIAGQDELTPEEKKEVEKLKKTDQDVKAHESAHMSAGAGVVMGGANYEYEHGPDGKMYAVSGEVKIDTSREKDPEATIRKMQKVRKAALAPAQPSATDRSVAAKASQIEGQARAELAQERAKEADNQKENQGPTPPAPSDAADPSSNAGHSINLIV